MPRHKLMIESLYLNGKPNPNPPVAKKPPQQPPPKKQG